MYACQKHFEYSSTISAHNQDLNSDFCNIYKNPLQERAKYYKMLSNEYCFIRIYKDGSMNEKVAKRRDALINLTYAAVIFGLLFLFFRYCFWVAAPFLLTFLLR